jgi:hypothetical protein
MRLSSRAAISKMNSYQLAYWLHHDLIGEFHEDYDCTAFRDDDYLMALPEKLGEIRTPRSVVQYQLMPAANENITSTKKPRPNKK